MRLFNALGLVISVILAFVSYYATSNIFIGGGVLIVSILFYLLVIFKSLKQHLSKTKKLHECYLFINNFLISLSIKESLNAAFEVTNTAISDEFKEYMDGIADLKPQEKLIYLNKYFRFQIYRLFTDIVLLWVEEGGNILEMSTHITNSSRECEEYLAFAESINRRKTLEVAILWLFSLAIIIALRIALTDFYDGLIKQPIFLVSVCLLMLIVLLSAFLLVRRITKIEIKGIENDE